jgi:glycopeptide antibiotics resistance protein
VDYHCNYRSGIKRTRCLLIKTFGKKIFIFGLGVYLVALLLFTLFPRPLLESSNLSELEEFLRNNANIFYKILYADSSLVYVGNYLLLFPFAVLVSWNFPSWSILKRILSAIMVSGFIEIFQLLIPGRVSDVVDFLSNILGAALGILVYELWRRSKS